MFGQPFAHRKAGVDDADVHRKVDVVENLQRGFVDPGRARAAVRDDEGGRVRIVCQAVVALESFVKEPVEHLGECRLDGLFVEFLQADGRRLTVLDREGDALQVEDVKREAAGPRDHGVDVLLDVDGGHRDIRVIGSLQPVAL